MEPTRPKHATLVDLLDRVLDKGLVIQADLVICVAGIPLVGANLRAALAGMQTMLDYGLLQSWDERMRGFASEEAAKREPPLVSDERVIVRVFGAHWHSRGIYRAWRPGHLYLTDRRIMLLRSEPPEVLFEAWLEHLETAGICQSTAFTGVERDLIHLHLTDGLTAVLSAQDAAAFLEAAAQQISLAGRALGEAGDHPFLGLPVSLCGDRLLADGKMWHRAAAAGILSAAWRPGHLYLTDRRLLWRCSSDERARFEAGLGEIVGLEMKMQALGCAMPETPVLEVSCNGAAESRSALFSGEGLSQWEVAIREVALKVETCPGCEHRMRGRELLSRGCPRCGWQSPDSEEQRVESQPAIAP